MITSGSGELMGAEVLAGALAAPFPGATTHPQLEQLLHLPRGSPLQRQVAGFLLLPPQKLVQAICQVCAHAGTLYPGQRMRRRTGSQGLGGGRGFPCPVCVVRWGSQAGLPRDWLLAFLTEKDHWRAVFSPLPSASARGEGAFPGTKME